MDGPPPPEEDFSSLPLAERLDHKSWKARVSGYETLAKTFQSTASDADPAFRPYLTNPDILKKIVADSNAVAQEKGVEAVVTFVKFSGENASKTRDSVLPTLVDKCLGSTRSGTRTQAIELILQYIEVSNGGADVVPDVMQGLGVKQPKVVAGTISALKEIIHGFGTTVVPSAAILKTLPKMFAHTDKAVRLEATQLSHILYRNIGSAIDPFLLDLKPVQVKELKESFDAMDKEGKGFGTFKAERLTRSQQQQSLQDTEPEVPEAPELAPIDPRTFADEVDIGPSLPSGFQNAVASSKWKDRKDVLDGLSSTLHKTLRIKDTPELAALVKALAGRMSDANINCVIAAAGCIEGLAKGLSVAFAKHREVIVPPMLERLKERKQSVTDAIGVALDAVFLTTNLADVLPDILPVLASKNPQVKEGTLKFLHRCLSVTPEPPIPSQVKPLSETLAISLEDSSEGARNEAALCLGTLMKITGERALNPVMDSIADVRKAKVKEAFENAIIKCKSSSAAKAKNPIVPSVTDGQPRQAQTKLKAKGLSPPPSSPIVEESSEQPKAPLRAPPSRLLAKKSPTSLERPKQATPAQAPVKKPTPVVASAASGKASKPPSHSAASALDAFKYRHNPEEADALAKDLVPSTIITDLADPNWKTRLAALESMQEWLGGAVATLDSEVFMRLLAKKSWGEKNFQVSAKLYDIIRTLVNECPSFDKASGVLAIPHLSEKLGDLKLKKPAGDTLICIAEKFSLSFVLSQAYEPMAAQKSPKVLADSLSWIDQALIDFGIAGLSLKSLIEFLKVALKHSNAAVRASGTKTLVTVKLFAGPGIKDFLEDLNAQLLATIQTAFDQSEGKPPPVPSRTSADLIHSAPGGKSEADAGKSDPLDELYPRVELDRLIASTTILTDAKSDAWKTRKEALETLQGLLNVGSNKRLKPTMGEITQVLKVRITDSNKACQIIALDVISHIASGMNKPFEKYVKFFVGPIISVLADQKSNIRTAAVSTLSEITAACEGIDPLIHAISMGLESQNPLQRSSLLAWLTDWLTAHPPDVHSDLSGWVGPTVSCLDDRNADVRKGAQSLLTLLAGRVGYDKVVNEANSLKPASRAAVLPFLQSLRPNPNTAVATESVSALPGAEGNDEPTPQTAQQPVINGGGRPTGLRSKKIGTLSGSRPESQMQSIVDPARAKALPSLKRNSVQSIQSQNQNPPSRASTPLSNSVQPCPFIGSNADARKSRLAKDGSRWIIEAGPVRKELIELLQQQMETHVSRELLNLLFSNDHNAINDHLAGMSLISDCYANAIDGNSLPSLESTKSILLANCDLPLKYACSKIHEPQPNIISKSLDVIEHVVAFLRYVDYQLTDLEATCFIPTMVSKFGDARESVRMRIQQLMQTLPRIHAYSRIFQLIVDHGLRSKVAKTRQGSLDELANILKRSGIGSCEPSKVFPVIGAMISDKDASVRKSALSFFSEAYILVGEKIWSTIGNLSPKDKTQLDERLRRIPGSLHTSGDSNLSPSKSQSNVMNDITGPSSKSTILHGATTSGPNNPTPLSPTPQHRAESPALPRREMVVPTARATPASSIVPTPSGLRKSHLPSRLAHTFHRPIPPKTLSDDGLQVDKGVKPFQEVTSTETNLPPVSVTSVSRSETTHDDIGITISTILSNDPSRSVDALKRIQKILEETSTESSFARDSLADHSEGLIDTITVQVSHVFDRVDDLSNASTFRLAKHLMQTLHSFFTHHLLAESLTVETLTSLLEELTLRLLETDESKDPNIKEISRFINLILLKIFATGRRISVFRALFALLLKIVKPFPANHTLPDSQEAKVAELVLKCIWKLARNIPGDLDKQLLDPTEMFPAIEHSLQSIPPNDWRARATNQVPCGDMPLRTIKVIIQHVVAKFGDQVYDYLSNAFDDPSATIVYPYVYRILNSSARVESQSQRHSQSVGVVESSSTSSVGHQTVTSRPSSEISSLNERRSSSPKGRTTDSMGSGSGYAISSSIEEDPDNQLLKIINHISSETTGALHKEGITELHRFLKSYPHKKAKVDKLLESTGPAFRKYLARALASRVAEDEEREAAVAETLSRLEAVRHTSSPGSPPLLSTSPRRSSGTSESVAGDAEKLSRLHDIFQYRAGIAPLNVPPDKTTNGHAIADS